MEDRSYLHEDSDGAEEEDTDGNTVVESIDEIFRLTI